VFPLSGRKMNFLGGKILVEKRLEAEKKINSLKKKRFEKRFKMKRGKSFLTGNREEQTSPKGKCTERRGRACSTY
jgi:hypothetical protein